MKQPWGVPAVDPDFRYRNAEDLPTKATVRNLLSVNHNRDLEGHFTTDTYAECIAVRQWITQADRIDAYFSLHSAGLISPGLFFYVGSGANQDCVDYVASHMAAATPNYIPLLDYDLTGEAQAVLSPGFMETPVPTVESLSLEKPNNSLTFIAHHFQPQFMGVSEMPLTICPALSNALLSEIYRCNREFRQAGHIDHPLQEISLETQMFMIRSFITHGSRIKKRVRNN